MSNLRVSFPKPCDEPWDQMSPRGCNRHCASCDKVIHDLSAMTIEEVEALLRVDPEPCARARIGCDGSVEMKKSSSARRVAVAVGSSLSLAAAACQSLPSRYPPYGNISGTVNNRCWDGVVTAVSSDGRRYQGIVNQTSRKFVVRYVPHGTYRLVYSDERDLKDAEEIGNVVVSSEPIAVGSVETQTGCVITGLMIIDPVARG